MPQKKKKNKTQKSRFHRHHPSFVRRLSHEICVRVSCRAVSISGMHMMTPARRRFAVDQPKRQKKEWISTGPNQCP